MSDWRPRLIASDMDGTLLRGDDTVSPETVTELERYGVGFGDVLVFGDMPNDLPMIAAVTEAGGRAVAVANAHPEVRAAAAGRTSGHDVDGVARYLEAVLPRIVSGSDHGSDHGREAGAGV